jgi:hypothetical protein
MIIYIKKIKTKEGINSFDNEKIMKDIPKGYKASAPEPIVTYTSNHVILAYPCKAVAQTVTKPGSKKKIANKKK